MPATDLKNVLCYEDLLDAAPEASFAWCLPCGAIAYRWSHWLPLKPSVGCKVGDWDEGGSGFSCLPGGVGM